MPGRSWSPSLRQISSCLAVCASVERGPIVDEAGAGVRHRLAEHEPVELVADVVVMTDHLGIAAQRVTNTVRMRLLRRWWQRLADHAEAAGRRDGGGDLTWTDLHVRRDDVAQGGDDLEQIALEVELTGDERPSDAELAG